ncbi:MAG: hypothetical protein HC824_09810 [Synechococcales cyanobacterium RM1_1_8]|nr:hypothetical protein [Synechococcales cyanobacterium RM1_1_8]
MEISQNESSISLELVNPWELPLSQSLPSAERLCLDQALQQLLQALENPSLQEALCCIEQALKELGTLDSRPASIDSTKTALQAWEVEDYDHYFQICHVDTEQPLFCVVRGLLVTCQRFVEICLKIPCLDVQQVEQQKQGFISYSQLLRRIVDSSQL